jgi:hypothetical protein
MNMKKNFKIGQSNELIKSDVVYDLHNEFDFLGITLKTSDRTLRLVFKPNSQLENSNSPIVLNFQNVDYLEFSTNFGSQINSGLDEIGYKNPNDRDDNWLKSEQQANCDDHLFFRFDKGEFIRVFCQKVELIESDKAFNL